VTYPRSPWGAGVEGAEDFEDTRQKRETAGAVSPGRSHVPARVGGRYGSETLVLSPLLLMVKTPDAVEV
jgi:hypothetical protein